MALIGQSAYQYPEFKTLISSQAYTIPETNLNEARTLWQENRLLYSGNGEYYYEYCTGGKTGYTENALATLISFAERDGRRLVCVVMRCNPTTESYLDSIKLYNFCFTKYKLCKPLIDYDINGLNKQDTIFLGRYYSDMNHIMPKYYVNQDYSFYIRSFISDDDIKKNITFFKDYNDGKAGVITFEYDGLIYGETDISVNIPYINASSTDAIQKEQNKPREESKIFKYAKIVIIFTLFL